MKLNENGIWSQVVEVEWGQNVCYLGEIERTLKDHEVRLGASKATASYMLASLIKRMKADSQAS